MVANGLQGEPASDGRFGRTGEVVGVVADGATGQLPCVGGRVSAPEDDGGGGFAEVQPHSILTERPAGVRRERLERLEAADDEGRLRVGSDDDGRVVGTALQEAHGRYFGAKARGASVGDDEWGGWVVEMVGYGLGRVGQIEPWVVGGRVVLVE